MSSSILRAAIAAALVLGACSSDSSSSSGPPPPAPETLFDTLPAATPDKLRGVWENKQDQSGGSIDLRVRFIEKYVVGAAKCTATGSDTGVIAGGNIGLVTTDLDAATGKIEFGTLGLSKTENGLQCEASLPGGTYNFTIKDGALSLTRSDGAVLQGSFTKIGD